MTSRLARAALPAAGVLAAAALALHAGTLDAVAAPGQLGPGFWPRLVLTGLGAACLARLVVAWRRPAARPDPSPDGGGAPLVRRRLGAAVALVLLYAAAAPIAGFALATAAFVGAFMRVAGARRWAPVGLAALAGTTAVLYLFVKLVYLPLPKGVGPFESLTLTVYRALRLF